MSSSIINSLSRKFRHYFHVVSNVRPLYWIMIYLAAMPVFALIYYLLPDSQFRIPDGGATDYWSWLYYSIVTITTLGFGDYTPAHGWAQAITAIQAVFGISIFGFFLNSVGAMKSEIDVESEIEKQRMLHEAAEKDKLLQSVPAVIHNINRYLAYCYVVTTRVADRDKGKDEFNPDFKFSDMADLYKPTGLPFDHTRRPAVDALLKSAANTSLCLDSLQSRIDLSIWPKLLKDCFDFVANYQLFSQADSLLSKTSSLVNLAGGNLSTKEAEKRLSDKLASTTSVPDSAVEGDMYPIVELYDYIRENGEIARRIEVTLSEIAGSGSDSPSAQ